VTDTSAAGPLPTVLEYVDPAGFRGFLAYSGRRRPLAAGGLRVQAGLTGATIGALAEAMRRKEEVLQLNVDGAKCGIDFDPSAPGKADALRRFLRWLKPHLDDRLSLGPDMGTTFTEIEALARCEGISSVKAAIGRAQGLPERQVMQRLDTLDSDVGALTVGQRRAGHALAHVTLAAASHVGLLSCAREPVYGVQGFGTLGRGAAAALWEAGARVTAIADVTGCISRSSGLNVERLLSAPQGRPLVAHSEPGALLCARETILGMPLDVLLLAACEDAVTSGDVARLQASVVVVGANNGLRPGVEAALHARGVVVVPDVVGGVGGSAAMDAIFAPAARTGPETVLARVGLLARTLVERTLALSSEAGMTPRQAAFVIAERSAPPVRVRPYGLRLLRGVEHGVAGCAAREAV
jgi:glutamate dehydrogenase (NAD(P)+)